MQKLEEKAKTTDDVVKWALGIKKGESSPYVILTKADKQWVRLETAQQEIGKLEILLKKYNVEAVEYEEKVEKERGEWKKKLQQILEDMKHIPSRRLPLGKNSWLQEWNEVIELLERLLK